jgi:alpha 1,3-glucosidase
VALDDKGRAFGDLYLDDGSSFAYQRGVYAHRLFTFADGQLRAAAVPSSPDPPAYGTGLMVERIVILGLRQPGSSYAVKVAATGAILEASSGPVVMQAGLPEVALVVRRPELPVSSDWAIQLLEVA